MYNQRKEGQAASNEGQMRNKNNSTCSSLTILMVQAQNKDIHFTSNLNTAKPFSHDNKSAGNFHQFKYYTNYTKYNQIQLHNHGSHACIASWF